MILSLIAAVATTSFLDGWNAKPGWKVAGDTVTVNASSDQRLVGSSLPPQFRWRAKVSLREGRSAGVLFGLSADGANGYVARIDSRLGQLILAKIGPWPKEDRLATYRWEPIDGATVTFRVEAGLDTARIFVEEKGKYPLLEARNILMTGDHLGLYGLDAEAKFSPGKPEEFQVPSVIAYVPQVGAFKDFYDPSPSVAEPWYINDHCLIHGDDGWHLFGITHPQPANPMDERNFAHATSPSLTEGHWQKQPFALTYDPSVGENHLWAPHVIKKGDTYYMFYCAGSRESSYRYRIHLATSKDLFHWTRDKDNPMFVDFYDARDPMVLQIDGTYYLYYTANLDSPEGHHIVNVRNSKDLRHWSPARVALIHPEVGTFGGPTESPFVVHFGDHFYLFVGPDGSYHATKVYRSCNPNQWNVADQVGGFPSHACEIVQDLDGKYYATDAGWDKRGVALAPLTWVPVTRQ